MTYLEWKNNNSEILSGKSEYEMLLMYLQYIKEKSSINPIVEDVSDKKTPSSLQLANTANNTDMLGTTDFLTLIGVATGSSTITKVGLLGNTAVNAILQLKSLKGLKGINKTAGISGVAGGVADSMDRILFGNLYAKNSNLTNNINSVYDMTSSSIMGMGPYGAMIGGAMKVGGLLSDGLSAMGIGTDQMTTADKILDSKFLKLTPVGLVNAIGAKSSDKFTVDNNIRSLIGGSYGGAYAFMDDAASTANKSFGTFSGGSRHEANRKSREAKSILETIGNINKDARDMRSIIDNSLNLLTTNYLYKLSGALDQRYIRAAKFGDKILRIKKINFSKKGGLIHLKINLETKEVEWEPVIIHRTKELKLGGTIDLTYDNLEPTIINDEWEPIIIESTNQLKNGGELKHTPDTFLKKEEINKKSRSLLELIEYSKKVNPRFILRLSEPFKYIEWIDDNGEKLFGTHELGYAEVDGKYVIFPNILERDDKQLFRYTDFRLALDNALKNKNVLWVDAEDEAKLFTESNELENGEFSGYKSGWPEFFKLKPKFLKGGKTEELLNLAKEYYKDYDLSGINLIEDNSPRTEGNNIYVSNDEDAIHELWHYLSKNKPNEKYKEFYDNLDDERIKSLGGDLNFVKRVGDPGIFYQPSELEARIMAAKYKSKGVNYTKDFFKVLREADENKYGYNMRDLLHMYNDENLEKIFNLKNGGELSKGKSGQEETNLKNIIPEGALHARLHHMDNADEITKKGIPVIDDKGEQLAEIELNEIIFNLEVTKKLEELCKDGSDEAAIEAGKLLVLEILFNTEDRTGLINTLKLGGIINGNTE